MNCPKTSFVCLFPECPCAQLANILQKKLLGIERECKGLTAGKIIGVRKDDCIRLAGAAVSFQGNVLRSGSDMNKDTHKLRHSSLLLCV